MMNPTEFELPEFQLRILLLEDLPDDEFLIERQIQVYTSNYSLKCVAYENEFQQQLQQFKPHIILADFRLPEFDGFAALALAKSLAPDVPFIFVTGALDNEELAAETILAGASNFVLKNNLKRLPTVLAETVSNQLPKWSTNDSDTARRIHYHNNLQLVTAVRKYLEALDKDDRETASAEIQMALAKLKKDV